MDQTLTPRAGSKLARVINLLAVGKLSLTGASQADIRDLIDRVTVSRTAIQVQLSQAVEADADARTLTFPWTLPAPYLKRETIQGESNANTSARPMRA